jgi:protein O-mannosyl-transferase
MTPFASQATEMWDRASDRQRTAAMLAVLIAAAFLPYLNSLTNGFAFDDAFIVQNNSRVHNLKAWRDIWLTPYWPSLGRELGLYRPLTIFLFAVQWAIGDGARWVFHLTNVSLHAGVCVLVFLLLRRLTAAVPALLGAIVFAVHPLHTEAVANVVGQAELTAAAFVLTACLIHASRPEGLDVSWTRRVAITILYVLALLAKESAVVLPGLLVLLDFVQRRVTLSAAGMRAYTAAMAVPIFLLVSVLICYLSVRYDALGATLTGTDTGPSFPHLKEHRLLNAFRAFPEYLRLLFFPADLTTDYVPATVFAVTTLTLMSAVGLILLIGLTLLMCTTPWLPLIGAAPAWFLISLSPVSNIFFPIGVLVAERTLYLPSVALSIIIAFTAANMNAAVTPRARRIITYAFGCALLAMGVRTWIRNPDWKNTSAVQAAVFRDHPESYHAQWARALVEWDRANLDESARWFKLAITTYPRDSGMLNTYGAFLMAVGEDDAALGYVKTAHEMHPFMPNVTALLAFLYITTRQNDSALAVISLGEQARFPVAMTLGMRAYVYQSQGRLAEAAGAWKVAAARINNGNWLAHAYHARTLAYDHREAEALEAIERGLALVPDSANRALLGHVRNAVTQGCYRDADPTAIRDLYGPPEHFVCDPLGSWFDRATYVQGASFSHYAIPRRLITAARVREKKPK